MGAARMNLSDVDLSPIIDHWTDLAEGFRLTIELGSSALLLAALIGAAATAARLSGRKFLAFSVSLYVEAMRGTPSLVLILACYYLLPATGLQLDAVESGVAALALYYGAYFAEAIRGALATVSGGQREAGSTIGLSPGTIFRRIVLPQALGPMLPPMTGLTIGLFKETALLSTISVHEFVFAGKEAISDSYAPFEIYAVVALCYWGLSVLIGAVAQRWERRAIAYRSPRRPEARA